MEDILVSLETARLLRERGFCEGSTHFYSNLNSKQELIDNKGAYYINGMELDYIEAPTQSLAQKWIREKMNIHIEIYAIVAGWGWILTKCEGNGSTIKNMEDFNFLDTYEEALEEGLKEALKLIQ